MIVLRYTAAHPRVVNFSIIYLLYTLSIKSEHQVSLISHYVKVNFIPPEEQIDSDMVLFGQAESIRSKNIVDSNFLILVYCNFQEYVLRHETLNHRQH